jgi:hypothetical protein
VIAYFFGVRRLGAALAKAPPRRRTPRRRIMKSLRNLATALVLLHFLVSIPHGMAHSELHIQMQLWQNVYIWIIITLLANTYYRFDTSISHSDGRQQFGGSNQIRLR